MKSKSFSFILGMILCTLPGIMEGQNTTTHPLVICHRGYSGMAPENTLAAVQKAIAIGVPVIEIDVHLSKDRHLIILHDATVDRTTNGKGAVKDLELSYLKSLDAGSWFSDSYQGEKIPTLEEVIQLVAGKCTLLIEVKPTWADGQETEKQVVGFIRKYNASEWCIVQSFDTQVLENIRMLEPSLVLHKLVIGNIPVLPFHYDTKWRWGSMMQYKQFAAINPYYKLLTKGKVKKLHKRGQKVFAWTVDDPEKIAKTARKGVDGIITNYPARAITVLTE